MEDYLKEALQIVKAQASTKIMTEDDMLSMAKSLFNVIRGHATGNGEAPEVQAEPAMDPKKAIKAKIIVCLECGEAHKILSNSHLAGHGLTQESYREKWSYPKSTPLCCKELARKRSENMKSKRLWEMRKTIGKKPLLAATA